MALPDTSAIDAAILALLLNDATLAGLMPDGVYWDVGEEAATQFVVVSQLTHDNVDAMASAIDPAPLFERPTYLVKAVEENASGANVKAAAARIHELMQGARLTIAGYVCMTCRRLERIRYVEINQQTAARWNHRGGHYQVWAATA
jgi:hypothetical protein